MDADIHESELSTYLSKFVSASENPFIVITAIGTDHFVQFSHVGDKAVMDFPQITPDQRSRADSVRGFAAKHGLVVDASDEFLDMDCALDAGLLERLIRDAFRAVFGLERLERLNVVIDE